MIANVWPESHHLEETLACLKFATRMMKVNNEASVNVI
jgi:kinesin family protein 6/9